MDFNTLLTEFIQSLNLEINTRQKRAKRRPFVIKDGQKTSSDANGKIYRFNEFNYNVIPDSPAEVAIVNEKSSKEERRYNATVIDGDDDVLSLYISGEDLPDLIDRALLIVDDTKLLEGVKNTISRIKNREENPPKDIANALFGLRKIKSSLEDYQDIPEQFNSSQCETIRKSLGSDATYIWGPPGTGKSATLSFIADVFLKKGMSILISAHTNEAVDNVMEKLIDSFSGEEIQAGKIIRWRVTRSEKLQPITPGYIGLAKITKIKQQINDLRMEKELLSARRNQLQSEYQNDYQAFQDLHEKYEVYQTCQKQYDGFLNELKTVEMQIAKVDEEISDLKSKLVDYEKSFFVLKLIRKGNKANLESTLTEKLSLTINLSIRKEQVVKNCQEKYVIATKSKDDYEKYFNELYSRGVSKSKLKNNLGDLKQLSEDIDAVNAKIIGLEKELASIKNFEYELLKNARVVGTTLTSATLNAQLRERVFDIVIIDEVSMAPCPNLYAACSLAKKKSVLCGDFYQLSPIAENKNAGWLSKSLFDRLGITQKVASGQNITELTILDTQFRCHPRIANAITNIVYNGKLKNGYQETHPNFYAQYLEPYAGEASVILDVSRICTISNPWCQKMGNSWVNVNSAELTLKLTQQALASGIKTIGIITPYRAQARDIKKKIKYLHDLYPDSKVEAATVHRYQGREMDMIIFDLIDCYPKENLAPFLTGGHGTESMRLINVATTRARGKLIVIANVDYIEQKLRENKKAILFQWIQYLKTQRHVYLNSISELKYTM